jgi:hypothetical protein
MSTESELKSRLQSIAANDYRVPDGAPHGGDYWQVSLAMLAHLGAIDPELRDDLIYTTFTTWARAELYTPDQYRALLSTTLDQDHVFLGLGERDTDSVFTRSFSILFAVLPIYHHRLTPIFTQHELRATLDQVLNYFAREADLRGYVDGKGWAHAVAHTADLLDEFAQCEEIDRDGLLRILDAIKAKLLAADVVFIAEEDERLAYAVLSLFGRGVLIERDIEPWIKSFAPIERTAEGWRTRHITVKHFLRSLYFQAKYRHIAEWICAPIDETLYAITRFK